LKTQIKNISIEKKFFVDCDWWSDRNLDFR
jgi:hypothetical protein